MTDTCSPRELLRRKMDGYLSTQLLFFAVHHNVPDLLSQGPRDVADVAARLRVSPAIVCRVLRGLVVEGILTETPDGQLALTEAGQHLRSDAESSMRGSVLARGHIYYRAAAGLVEAAERGADVFTTVFGVPLFEHLAGCPAHSAAFQQAMTARSSDEASDMLATYSFDGAQHIVDVGGGCGVTLAMILERYPRTRGTLLERDDVSTAARDYLRSHGVLDRCTVVTGDFFNSVPAGGDVYILSRVIHDWDDESSIRILNSVRRALGPESRVLILEAVLSDRASDSAHAVRMDLHMLTLTPGRERTLDEFRTLLTAAHLDFLGTSGPTGTFGINIIEATWGGSEIAATASAQWSLLGKHHPSVSQQRSDNG